MSGSNSSAHGSRAEPEAGSPLALTVHSLSVPALEDGVQRRTRAGRLKMLLVLLVCAAPVVASYFTYFVIRPNGRTTNYGELIEPLRPIPSTLPLQDLQGRPVAPASLRGQWLVIVVAGGACDPGCERLLWLQRQLRETLGAEKDRLDKVWLIPDRVPPRTQTLQAIAPGPAMAVLHTEPEALADWLVPAAGRGLEQHLYVVDPMGNWMLREPPDPEPARLKRDIERLLRASASWDRPGR